MLFRCTAKLLKLVGRPASEVPEPAAGSWFANLLWFDRRKCLLLAHSETLYMLFVPNVTKAELQDLGALVRPILRRSLFQDGLGFAYERLSAGPDSVAKTNNRSVLGSMNDAKFMLEAEHMYGAFDRGDTSRFTTRLNQVPYSALPGYGRAVGAVKQSFTEGSS